MTIPLIFTCTVACYLISIGILIYTNSRNISSTALRALASVSVILGLICHGFLLYHLIGKTSINLALGLMFSATSWFVLSVWLAYSLKKQNLSNLGIITIPATVIAVVIGYYFPGKPLYIDTIPVILRWHLLLAIPAFVLICMAFAQSILLLIQEHHLKQPRSIDWFPQLPAMETMNRSLHGFILSGFILVSINLAFGIFVVNYDTDYPFQLDHHFIFIVLCWLCLFSIQFGRIKYGWHSAITAKWTIAAFIFLVLSYFGTRFVSQVILA